MKKTFLIFAMGAMGLTVVNAQQQPRTGQMDRSQQEITNQLSDGMQLADLSDEMKDKIDKMIDEKDAQLVKIDRSDAEGYELTFRNGDRAWKQKFDTDGKTKGDETRIENEPRSGQSDNQMSQRTRTGGTTAGTTTGSTTGGGTTAGTTGGTTAGTTGGTTGTTTGGTTAGTT
ncbi:hypothetical protein, partial [Anditalea andensis]|uniref:hypothetical protein n=1 Tax=Anditalea andensis TaxID=1048983 RepID=UPI00196A10A7